MHKVLARKRFHFKPEWEGPIMGWTVRFALAQSWRVEPEFDADDIIQEGYLTFCKVRECYPLVRNPKHFMALFKTCLLNVVNTLSTRRTKRNQIQRHFDETIVEPVGHDIGISDAIEALMISDAPPAVRKLLNRLTSPHRVTPRMQTSGRRETTNEFFCRIVGLDTAEIDLRTIVTNWLEGVPQAC